MIKYRVFLLAPILSACIAMGTQAPAPIVEYGNNNGVGSRGAHRVQPGDTVWSVAHSYRVAMRDLIAENALDPPFKLEIGQKLDLPPPNTYIVKNGDSLYSISRVMEIDMNRLARQNNLKAPYRIHPGDELTLPGSSSTRIAASNKKSVIKKTRPSIPTTKQLPKRNGQFLKPVQGRVLSSFGPKANGLHNDGINILAPRGSVVRTAENGVVVYTGNAIEGYGNLVLVKHQDRYVTAYAHLDKILVKRGQSVTRGATLGKVGSTGTIDTPQLHFEIRRGTKALDPLKYL